MLPKVLIALPNGLWDFEFIITDPWDRRNILVYRDINPDNVYFVHASGWRLTMEQKVSVLRRVPNEDIKVLMNEWGDDHAYVEFWDAGF